MLPLLLYGAMCTERYHSAHSRSSQNLASALTKHHDAVQSQPNCKDQLAEAQEQQPSLVRELLCAAIHSRAAYGYAMAAGHMSTLLSFALMHTVHQIRCLALSYLCCCPAPWCVFANSPKCRACLVRCLPAFLVARFSAQVRACCFHQVTFVHCHCHFGALSACGSAVLHTQQAEYIHSMHRPCKVHQALAGRSLEARMGSLAVLVSIAIAAQSAEQDLQEHGCNDCMLTNQALSLCTSKCGATLDVLLIWHRYRQPTQNIRQHCQTEVWFLVGG